MLNSNWFKNLKVTCAINSRTAKIRAYKRAIESLEDDIAGNLHTITALKAQMALVDGNQLDLFVVEGK